MEKLGPVLWLVIIGAIFYFMMKRGGCCGGSGHGRGGAGSDRGEHRHEDEAGHDHEKSYQTGENRSSKKGDSGRRDCC